MSIQALSRTGKIES